MVEGAVSRAKLIPRTEYYLAVADDTDRMIGFARLGMRYEGRLRDHVYTNGAWRDSLLYAVLAHEWPTKADPA